MCDYWTALDTPSAYRGPRARFFYQRCVSPTLSSVCLVLSAALSPRLIRSAWTSGANEAGKRSVSLSPAIHAGYRTRIQNLGRFVHANLERLQYTFSEYERAFVSLHLHAAREASPNAVVRVAHRVQMRAESVLILLLSHAVLGWGKMNST